MLCFVTTYPTLRAIHQRKARINHNTTHGVRIAKRPRNHVTIRANMDTDNEQEEMEAFEQQINNYLTSGYAADEGPLAFENLSKAGRTDIMSLIIKYGGYAKVSQILNLDVSLFIPPSTMKPYESKAFPTFYKANSEASIQLGQNLDSQFDSINEINSSSSSSSSSTTTSTSSKLKRRTLIGDQVPSADEINKFNQSIKPPIIDKVIPKGESFVLTVDMRIGIVLLVAFLSVGYGRTSQTQLPVDVIPVCQSLANGLCIAHISTALYAGFNMAPKLNRDPILWFLKVLFSGPLGIRSLQSLGPINKNARS